MTQKETFTAIRALGLAVTCTDGEYRVTYRADAVRNAEHREERAYYTDDAQDALDTAKRMAALGPRDDFGGPYSN